MFLFHIGNCLAFKMCTVQTCVCLFVCLFVHSFVVVDWSNRNLCINRILSLISLPSNVANRCLLHSFYMCVNFVAARSHLWKCCPVNWKCGPKSNFTACHGLGCECVASGQDIEMLPLNQEVNQRKLRRRKWSRESSFTASVVMADV